MLASALGNPLDPSSGSPGTSTQTSQSTSVNDSEGLEEIVVTVRRREESLMSVPVAVTGVNAATLQHYDIDSMEKLGEVVPQLKMEKAASGSEAVFSIRGIGSSPLDSGIPQSVSLQIDDAVLSQGNLIELGLFDLQQVEVLKGPQALFFGKNSPAGVVSFTSKGPGTELDGYAKAGYEFNAQEKLFEAAVGGPITDTLGVRIAVRYRETGGWVYNDSSAHLDPLLGIEIPSSLGKNPQQREETVRLTVVWNPLSDLTATIKVLDQHYGDDSDASTYTTVACAAGQTVPTMLGIADPGNSCNFTNRHAFANNFPAIEATNISDGNGGIGYSLQNTSVSSIKLVYQQPKYSVTSVTSYAKYDFYSFGNFASSAYPYFGGYNGIAFESGAEEIRLASNLDGRFNFQAGTYFEYNSTVNTGYSFLGPFGPDPTTGRLVHRSEKDQFGRSRSIRLLPRPL